MLTSPLVQCWILEEMLYSPRVKRAGSPNHPMDLQRGEEKGGEGRGGEGRGGEGRGGKEQERTPHC